MDTDKPMPCRREFGYFRGDPDEIVWSAECSAVDHSLPGCAWHQDGGKRIRGEFRIKLVPEPPTEEPTP